MKPAPFAYARVRSLEHAVELLGESEARVLAGGQSLMATLNMRLSSPRLLVDINHIEGLGEITRRGSGIEIGALVRHSQAEVSELVRRDAPLIARALPHIGHPAIRNRGTLCGSVAFADPAAELPACLLALGGEVEIAGVDGRRVVKADEFFKGLFETALEPSDVLTAIRVPAATPETRIGFAEFSRRLGDYAIAGLAACARAYPNGLGDVRLAFFGLGVTPVRARSAETTLTGPLDEERLAAAVAALDQDLAPHDDVQASGKLKKHLAGVLLRRVAQQLAEPLR